MACAIEQCDSTKKPILKLWRKFKTLALAISFGSLGWPLCNAYSQTASIVTLQEPPPGAKTQIAKANMAVFAKRNYACRLCGRVRRAPADYIPGAPSAPKCCSRTMRLLSHEQTVAGARLSPAARASWLAAGGKVASRGGKRGWRAIRKPQIS